VSFETAHVRAEHHSEPPWELPAFQREGPLDLVNVFCILLRTTLSTLCLQVYFRFVSDRRIRMMNSRFETGARVVRKVFAAGHTVFVHSLNTNFGRRPLE
jgi:hypothetical protein